MKKLSLVLALALGGMATPPPVQGFEPGAYRVVQQEDFCFVEARFRKRDGEIQLLIYANADGKKGLYIGKTTWTMVEGKTYNIDIMFYDPDYNAGQFSVAGFAPWRKNENDPTVTYKGYAFAVADEVVEGFARSRRALISHSGVIAADLNLQGAGPYVEQAKRCAVR